MSQRVAAPVDKKPAPVPSVPVRGALPSYVPCNHARATHARLARAARYLEANATVTFSVLVRYGESGRSVTLRVPCLEGVTTAGDVLDVARARCPRGAAADALCTADGPGPPCVLPAAAVVNTLLCSGANVTAAPAGTVPVVVQPRRWRVCGASIPRCARGAKAVGRGDCVVQIRARLCRAHARVCARPRGHSHTRTRETRAGMRAACVRCNLLDWRDDRAQRR